MRNFYLITQPGFESAAKAELLRWLPEAKDVDSNQGGVSFATDLEKGSSLNLVVKIPTRILLRLHHGKCKKIEDLKELLLSLNLKEFYSDAPEISFSSTKSKLYHKKKIPEQVERFLKRELGLEKAKKPQKLFLRFDHDWLTVSVDTSGEALYKRTPFKRIGEAPLRETLGSALYQTLINEIQLSEEFELIDPMCGSGTILSEALRVNETVNNRDFAFKKFLKPVEMSRPTFSTPKKVFGFDNSKTTIESANRNFESLGINKDVYFLKEHDLFSDLAREKSFNQSIVITNPPHGNRLVGSQDVSSKDYAELIARIIDVFSPTAMGILLPQKLQEKEITPPEYSLKKKVEFSQNSNPVAFYIFAAK